MASEGKVNYIDAPVSIISKYVLNCLLHSKDKTSRSSQLVQPSRPTPSRCRSPWGPWPPRCCCWRGPGSCACPDKKLSITFSGYIPKNEFYNNFQMKLRCISHKIIFRNDLKYYHHNKIGGNDWEKIHFISLSIIFSSNIWVLSRPNPSKIPLLLSPCLSREKICQNSLDQT